MPASLVPPHKWRIAMTLLALVVGGGLLLTILLALGLADPPRAGALLWQGVPDDSWMPEAMAPATFADAAIQRAPVDVPAPPFTLEMAARNTGSADSAWGIWLRVSPALAGGADEVLTVWIRREGYLSVGSVPQPDWAGFIHIRPDDNRLYLYVEADGGATLRINGESAWRGALIPAGAWGVITRGQARMRWDGAAMYG